MEGAGLLTALGGASSAYSAYEGGQANAAVDRFNAANERIQAQQTLQSGATRAAREDTKATILRGQQTGSFAGQGVVVGAGTARAVEAGSEAVSAMDKLMIQVNARRQAYGFQTAAANSDFQAHLARVQGNEAALGALIRTGAKIKDANGKENTGDDPNAGLLAKNPDDMTDAERRSLLSIDSGYGAGDFTPTTSGNLNFH